MRLTENLAVNPVVNETRSAVVHELRSSEVRNARSAKVYKAQGVFEDKAQSTLDVQRTGKPLGKPLYTPRWLLLHLVAYAKNVISRRKIAYSLGLREPLEIAVREPWAIAVREPLCAPQRLLLKRDVLWRLSCLRLKWATVFSLNDLQSSVRGAVLRLSFVLFGLWAGSFLETSVASGESVYLADTSAEVGSPRMECSSPELCGVLGVSSTDEARQTCDQHFHISKRASFEGVTSREGVTCQEGGLTPEISRESFSQVVDEKFCDSPASCGAVETAATTGAGRVNADVLNIHSLLDSWMPFYFKAAKGPSPAVMDPDSVIRASTHETSPLTIRRPKPGCLWLEPQDAWCGPRGSESRAAPQRRVTLQREGATVPCGLRVGGNTDKESYEIRNEALKLEIVSDLNDVCAYFEEALGEAPVEDDAGRLRFERTTPTHWGISWRRGVLYGLDGTLYLDWLANDDFGLSELREFFEAPFFDVAQTRLWYAWLEEGGWHEALVHGHRMGMNVRMRGRMFHLRLYWGG
jgi:hypothetical protein